MHVANNLSHFISPSPPSSQRRKQMAAPKPESMSRFGLTPRPEIQAPDGSCLCNGYVPVAQFWEEQADIEAAVQQKTLAKLIETADALTAKEAELASVEKELAKTKEELAGTTLSLSDTTTNLKDTKSALEESQGDLEECRTLLEEMEAELSLTREGLYRRERQAAET